MKYKVLRSYHPDVETGAVGEKVTADCLQPPYIALKFDGITNPITKAEESRIVCFHPDDLKAL